MYLINEEQKPIKMDQEVNLTGLLYKWAIIMFNMKQTHRESKQCVLALYFLRLCDLTTNAELLVTRKSCPL